MMRATPSETAQGDFARRLRALYATSRPPIPVEGQDGAPAIDDHWQLEMSFGLPAGEEVPTMVGPMPRTAKAWQFLCLAEIVNFAALRRHIGRSRADRLAQDVIDRIYHYLPHARLSAIGHSMVELCFEGDERRDLDAALICLRVAFETPVELDGEPHVLELVFGAAAAPAHHSDEVRLAEEAEEAVRQARSEQAPVTRDLTNAPPIFDRISLARELRSAIDNDEMFLQYQPKVHLRAQKIASAEALIRWKHPSRGLILPSDFIPLAEDSRDIAPLTLWTLDRVISDQKILAARGHDLVLFINISGQLLGDANFVRIACEKVQSSRARVGFEITETSVIRDPQSAIAHLRIFADIGITVAIDDYGAGLSSLAYLKQLPARELKIDKLFVTQLTSSNRDPLIVRSTIDLAHALEMEVVAEGVETQAALALLTVMGCDMVQGFLISRPIGLEAFIQFLDEERHLTATQDSRTSFNRLASAWKRG